MPSPIRHSALVSGGLVPACNVSTILAVSKVIRVDVPPDPTPTPTPEPDSDPNAREPDPNADSDPNARPV